jgi:plasmid stabilization system protein ParE
MPRAWSPKRERQYEHIKESYEERGVSEDEAEERAARTVNKDRAEAGETKRQKARSKH